MASSDKGAKFLDEQRAKGNGAGPKFADVPAAPVQPFPCTWVSDAVLKLDTRPIVKGLIDPGSFVVIYGPSQSGKSFFTADIAQCVATGAPWRGRKVQHGLVVYIASEAGGSILKRFIAWRDNRLGESTGRVPLAVLTRGPNLLASVEVEKLVEQLAAMQREAGLPLVLVVFDTLSRSMHGADENSAEDVTMAVNAADIIRDQFGAATVYVHHTGKDVARGARGHYALTAAADLILRVEDKVAQVEKMRDGMDTERFAFELEPVVIGQDADGEPVVTCLLNHKDEFVGKPTRPDPQGKNQKIVLKEIRLLAGDADVSPGTSDIPRGVPIMRYESVIERCEPRFVGMEGFRARARISEAIMGLQATGFVGCRGDLVWLLY
jgi:KaiC/GvpD/RAD55 family RecA-like ATPase